MGPRQGREWAPTWLWGPGGSGGLGESLEPSISEVAPSPNLGLYLGSCELGLLKHRHFVSLFAHFLELSLNSEQRHPEGRSLLQVWAREAWVLAGRGLIWK